MLEVETDDENEREKRKKGEKIAEEWVGQQQRQQAEGDGDYNNMVDGIINTSEAHAIAMEQDNEQNQMSDTMGQGGQNELERRSEDDELY